MKENTNPQKFKFENIVTEEKEKINNTTEKNLISESASSSIDTSYIWAKIERGEELTVEEDAILRAEVAAEEMEWAFQEAEADERAAEESWYEFVRRQEEEEEKERRQVLKKQREARIRRLRAKEERYDREPLIFKTSRAKKLFLNGQIRPEAFQKLQLKTSCRQEEKNQANAYSSYYDQYLYDRWEEKSTRKPVPSRQIVKVVNLRTLRRQQESQIGTLERYLKDFQEHCQNLIFRMLIRTYGQELNLKKKRYNKYERLLIELNAKLEQINPKEFEELAHPYTDALKRILTEGLFAESNPLVSIKKSASSASECDLSEEDFNKASDESFDMLVAAESLREESKSRRRARNTVAMKNYKLQTVLQNAIARSSLGLQLKLKNRSRCCRSLFTIPGEEETNEVLIRRNKKKAYYKSLFHCKNIWSCPVCTPYILAKRSEEIDKALEYAYKHHQIAVMATFTAWHSKNYSLDRLIEKFKAGIRKFKSGQAWQDIKFAISFTHSISGYECTYGEENGHHWHLHMLLIVNQDKKAVLSAMEDKLKRHWMRCYQAVGGYIPEDRTNAFYDYGFVLSRNSDGELVEMHSGKYLCGWGGDDELTGGCGKAAKQNNRNMFELLESENEEDIKAFLEYANATHGKRRMIFSRGLKELVGIEEIADEDIEIEDEPTDEDEDVAAFSKEAWKVVLDYETEVPARYEILVEALVGGYPAVAEYCENLGIPLPRPRGQWAAKKADENLTG